MSLSSSPAPPWPPIPSNSISSVSFSPPRRDTQLSGARTHSQLLIKLAEQSLQSGRDPRNPLPIERRHQLDSCQEQDFGRRLLHRISSR
jgi:hypothetical protein